MVRKKYNVLFLFLVLLQFTAAGQETNLFKKYDLDKITLPPGFSISVFAEVPNARSMCWGEKGTLFVGNRSKDKVYAVLDDNKDGKAEKVFVIDDRLNMPNGVAFRKGSLYVAEVNRILRYDGIENRLGNPPEPVVVNDKLPSDKHHGWKFIAFGPDDKLYVPVGAPCNICEKENEIYASLSRMNPDGSGLEVYASGIRNTVGFDWHPATKELWFTENGRDNMGDDMPAEELNHAPKKGMHFGFPYCHQGDTPDPEFGNKRNCSEFTPPAKKLMPHAAALGMRFYTGKMFLPEYRNQVFIAEHGSWNRSEKSGYRVTMIRLENNKVVQYVPFATGWLNNNGKVTGRPVDIEIAADGAMLVSDDARGAIYRIVFSN
ncbi:MAG: sorbosone dehydrogenase family protein [Chitinophagaceae bacterium]|nr:sorbosone dehydrogenase family protein [Chitinophagaceae bacterium]